MTPGEIAIWQAVYGAAYIEIRRRNPQWSRDDVTLDAVEEADRAVASLRALVGRIGLYREVIA